MHIAKLFTNGNSQAVRLPKDCRFTKGEKEVYVHKLEGMVMLIPKKNPWGPMLNSLNKFTDDFMSQRAQPSHHDHRENLA
jgi:antitoxin VapB